MTYATSQIDDGAQFVKSWDRSDTEERPARPVQQSAPLLETRNARMKKLLVELEPIADEDQALEDQSHQGGDLETHGRVDLVHDMTRYDAQRLHGLIENHMRYTGSDRARQILANWDNYLPRFVKVMPVDYRRALQEMQAQTQAAMRTGESVAVGGE